MEYKIGMKLNISGSPQLYPCIEEIVVMYDDILVTHGITYQNETCAYRIGKTGILFYLYENLEDFDGYKPLLVE